MSCRENSTKQTADDCIIDAMPHPRHFSATKKQIGRCKALEHLKSFGIKFIKNGRVVCKLCEGN